MDEQNQSIPCKDGHTFNGIPWGKAHQHLHLQVCDCKRVIGSWEKCDCQSNPHMELKIKPNPNY